MKYLNITDKFIAAEYFSALSKSQNMGTSYRALDSNNGDNVISNVPPEIYTNPALKKYNPPSIHGIDNGERFISFLHESLNFFHHNFPDARLKYPDGKLFHYNHCYDNSLSVYFGLQNLSANNHLPITKPISVCFGYVSNTLMSSGLIGDAIISIENLIVHDWHAWNMVNGFIIDLSTIKTGGIYALSTKKQIWEKAEDHIFKYPPKNISYTGISFEDHKQFIKYVHETLKIHL